MLIQIKKTKRKVLEVLLRTYTLRWSTWLPIHILLVQLKYADVVLVDEEIIYGMLCRNDSNWGCIIVSLSGRIRGRNWRINWEDCFLIYGFCRKGETSNWKTQEQKLVSRICALLVSIAARLQSTAIGISEKTSSIKID